MTVLLDLLIASQQDCSLPNEIGVYMIVRDELMNPAGGIEDAIECIAPFTEYLAILDTGSKDGTFDFLKEAEKKVSNLNVFQSEWKGFSDARNKLLGRKIRQTKHVLMLDSDERIFSDGLKLLKKIFNSNACAHSFHFEHVNPDDDKVSSCSWNERLFIG